MSGNHPSQLSPRQRMINMMYLVLTALLALNVSKEVLNSFFEVNLGIVRAADALHEKNNDIYNDFREATNQVKVKPYKDLAEKVRPVSNELDITIQKMKYDLVLRVDKEVYLGEYLDEKGDEIEKNAMTKDFDKLSSSQQLSTIAHLSNKEDRDASGDLFLLPKNGKRAENLKSDIESYKTLLLNILQIAEDSNLVASGSSKSIVDDIQKTLDLSDKKGKNGSSGTQTWEEYNFLDMPSVGSLTLLSKLQTDIKNMELEVIGFLAKNIDASSLKFTSAEAITIPASNFVLKGDQFESKIFLTAFDETANPEIYIGDYDSMPDGTYQFKGDPEIVPVIDGQGNYIVRGNSVGPKRYKGLIKILQDDGDQYYPFSGEYLVAEKSFAVSATQMNVLYANDIENPIKVSVAGYQPEDIKIYFSAGQLTTVNRKKGEYIVKPSQDNVGKEVNISVSVKKKEGGSQSIGKSVFRVKNVPGQTIGARYSDGLHAKNKIMANTFSSKIKDFDFPIKFYVSEFTVVCIGSKRIEKKVQGFKISPEAQTEIDKLEKGQTVLFKDFVVKQKSVPTYLDRPKDKFELIIE